MKLLEKLKPGVKFRVAGERATFVFHDLTMTGRGGKLPVIKCWSEETGWRFLYVGAKPTTCKGLKIKPYRITKIVRK